MTPATHVQRPSQSKIRGQRYYVDRYVLPFVREKTHKRFLLISSVVLDLVSYVVSTHKKIRRAHTSTTEY